MAQKHFLGDIPVILRVGMSIEVKGQPHAYTAFDKELVILLDDTRRRQPFGIRLEHDRRAVGIRATDHQYIVADHALIAGKDIRRQVRAGNLTDMFFPVNIGPGDPHQNLCAVCRHIQLFQSEPHPNPPLLREGTRSSE